MFCYVGMAGTGPLHHGEGGYQHKKGELSVLGRARQFCLKVHHTSVTWDITRGRCTCHGMFADDAQPAQSCRHSCGQQAAGISSTSRAGSQPNCNTLPACPSVVCLFHLLLPVCLCLPVCLSNLVKVRASLLVSYTPTLHGGLT